MTLSLPIARPFKLQVYYVPYEMFKADGNTIIKNEFKGFNIALSKKNKVADLKQKVI